MRMPLATLRLWEEAVEQVEHRVQRVTSLLDRHSIPYQVVGGLAVASWVARADPSAVRATKDVDIAIRRNDLDRAKTVLEEAGYRYRYALGVHMFLDPGSPRARDAIHLIFENEKVRPEYAHSVPPIAADAPRSQQDYAIVPLPSLVRMKLTSFRDKDRTHLRDMIEVGIITPEIEATLPPDLLARLEELKNNPDG